MRVLEITKNKIRNLCCGFYFRQLICCSLFFCCIIFPFFIFAGDSVNGNDKVSISFIDTAFYYLYLPITYLFPHIENRKTIYETESQYFYIRVEEDDSGYRHLVFLPRKGSQSIFDPKNPEKIISNFIHSSALALPVLGRQPEKLLFLGMGGGIMPMLYRRNFPETKIDIVEIDKAIPGIAENYFAFKKDAGMSIFIQDARTYANKNKKKYDIIFMDIYNANNIPFQVTTKEFFQQIKRSLYADGVLYINLANLNDKKFISSELRTVFSVFPDTYVFASGNESNYNIISTVNNNTNLTDIEKTVSKMDKNNLFEYKLEPLLDSVLNKEDLIELMSNSRTILTDDYAPTIKF